MSFVAQVVLVLVVVAAACALPGTFLVLRRMSLVSDAVSHVLLFGVVVMYFSVRDVGSPWLRLGAAASGVLTVALVELLQRTKLVREDAAIGLVFPALFALGVLLASMFLRNTHLDVDAVLLGQPELATESGLWVIGSVLALNVALLVLLFKELKLTTFDPALAASLGFRPAVMHYGLMTVVSVTAVAAFDVVGPVLVVGLFVIPAATAFLLTDRLAVMVALAAAVGAFAAASGTWAAFRLDTNIAGTVTTVLGLLFAAAFLAAPGRGLVAQMARRVRQRRAFFETMLAVHLLQHEGTAAELEESRVAGLHQHLNWTPARVAAVVGRAERDGLVVRDGDRLRLTDEGRERARAILGEGRGVSPT